MKRLILILLVGVLILSACAGKSSASFSAERNHSVTVSDGKANICGLEVNLLVEQLFNQKKLIVTYGGERVEIEQGRISQVSLGGKQMKIAFNAELGEMDVYCGN